MPKNSSQYITYMLIFQSMFPEEEWISMENDYTKRKGRLKMIFKYFQLCEKYLEN